MKQIVNKLVILTLSLLIISCNEDDKITNPHQTVSSSDSFKIEQEIAAAEMAVSNIAHVIQLALDQEQVLTASNAYPIITKEKLDPNQPNLYPLNLVIDFGVDTVAGFDHRYRCGKIIAKISANWKDSLSVIEAKVQNYYFATHTPNYSQGNINSVFVNECNVSSKLKIINKGLTNGYDNTYYPTQEIYCDSTNISSRYGNITFSTSRYVLYKEGFETPTYLDDKTINLLYSSGEALSVGGKKWIWNARNVDDIEEGHPYFAFNRDCYWLVSGNINLAYKDILSDSDFIHRIIGFGQSDQTKCDNSAFFSFKGIDIIFQLP